MNDTTPPSRVAQILRNARMIKGPIAPDREAFERILKVTNLRLRDETVRGKARLFPVFDQVMCKAFELSLPTPSDGKREVVRGGLKRQRRPQFVFRNTTFLLLCGFYEVAFPRKASAGSSSATPPGPTVRFLKACLEEERRAIEAFPLEKDIKAAVLTEWTLPSDGAIQEHLKDRIIPSRKEAGDHDPVAEAWNFARRLWEEKSDQDRREELFPPDGGILP